MVNDGEYVMVRGKDTWGAGYARSANSPTRHSVGRVPGLMGTGKNKGHGPAGGRARWLPWLCMACVLGTGLAGLQGMAQPAWGPSVSAFRGEFHRFTPVEPPAGKGETALLALELAHEVSGDLVEWRGAGEGLKAGPRGRWLGSCATEDALGASGLGGGPVHVVMAMVQGDEPGLCLAGSTNGRSYAWHSGNPVLRVKGASGAPSVLWHAASARWILGVPVRDAGGGGLQFHGSSNLVSWVELGRMEGGFEGGGLVELPVQGASGAARWMLVDSKGAAWAGKFDGQRLVGGPRGLVPVRGDVSWAFAPARAAMAPGGRWLVVGKGPGTGLGDGWMPWEVSLAGEEASPQVVWEPARESEGRWVRSRSFEPPRNSAAATNAITSRLPRRFELRLEMASQQNHRLTVRMSGDEIEFSGKTREMVINGQTWAMGPGGALERWVVVRTPDRLEVVASGGRVRACVVPRQPEAGGPLILERPGAWWVHPGLLVMHELREPTAVGLPGRGP